MVTAADLLTPEARIRLREVTNDLTKRAQACFGDSVVPIYGSKENSRPAHLGSAILLNINDTKVLLTAAHVIDENAFTTLYVGGAAELNLLEGEFSITQAPSGRDRDQYDFAFCAITESLVTTLKGHFINLSEMVSSVRPEPGRLYTALGYPSSKHRKYNPLKRSVRTHLFSYSSIHKLDNNIAKKLPGEGSYHLFITYNKRSKDEEGNIVNSTSPKGMSGGAVIDAGRPLDLFVFKLEPPTPLLAGVVIELKQKKVLLALRMHVILPALLKAFPSAQNAQEEPVTKSA